MILEIEETDWTRVTLARKPYGKCFTLGELQVLADDAISAGFPDTHPVEFMPTTGGITAFIRGGTEREG